MSAAIPQPSQYVLTGGFPPSNLFDDMVPLVSSSSHNTSFFPSSALSRMSTTSSPMNQIIMDQYQSQPLPPSVDHLASNNVLFPGNVQLQQTLFPQELAGMGFPHQQQQQQQQHQHHPPPAPSPAAVPRLGLQIEHPPADTHQPSLLNGPQRTSIDDIGSHVGQLPPASSSFDRRSSYPATLPSTERSGPPSLQKSNTFPQQKKRGRKPKNHNLTSSGSGSPLSSQLQQDDDLDEDGLPKDPRRRRILERNRIAATKCRLRKRDEASALASREQQMEDQNRYLANCFDSLTAEIYQLKTQLLRHTECNCVLIQKYIAIEAKKSVKVLAPSPPPPSFADLQHHHQQQHLPPSTASAMASAAVSGSASSYPCSRLGSSTGSASDSTGLQSPEGDGGGVHGAIQWTNPVMEAAATNNPQAPPPTHSLLEPSPDSLCATHSVPMTPANLPPGYGEGLYIGVGTQSQQANDVGWDVQWDFQH